MRFFEAVYHEALAIEFDAQAIPFRREAELPVAYRGHTLSVIYRADFICYETIVVEIKAIAKLSGVEEAQLLNYLKASNQHTGLLLNFGRPSLEWRRLVNTPSATTPHESKSP